MNQNIAQFNSSVSSFMGGNSASGAAAQQQPQASSGNNGNLLGVGGGGPIIGGGPIGGNGAQGNSNSGNPGSSAFQDADMSGAMGTGGGNIGIQNSQGGAGESQDYCWQMIKINGQPPSTRNCHSSTQFGQYLIVFGGREGDGKKRIVNDIFIFDTEKSQWNQPKVDKQKLPQPRMGHSSQLWNGSHIIIYGGWNGFSVLSDVIFIILDKFKIKLNRYLYNLCQHSENVQGSKVEKANVHTNLQNKINVQQNSLQSVRFNCTISLINHLEYSLLFDKIDQQKYNMFTSILSCILQWGVIKDYLNLIAPRIFIDLRKGVDKLTFNIPSIIRGEAPMRQFHTASVIDNQMYVFGGGDGKYWLNDLLVFDLVNLEWSGPVQTNGIAPVGRLQHSAITFDKKIYIFGGEPDQFRQLNDIFYLDTTTLTWVKPIVNGEEPSARVSTTGCLIDSKIYYFGGYDGVQWMNDVHVFDIDSNRWSKVQTYGYKPRPRCRHTANIVKGQLYIFGGNDCELSFNDIWVLSIGVQVPEPTIIKDLTSIIQNFSIAEKTSCC